MKTRPEIIYVFDTHCGWCYGFSQVIHDFEIQHREEFDFKVLNGGLITGDRVGPIGPMAEYILSAIPRLEEMTGMKVGESYKAILRDGKRVMDSLPPATAFRILSERYPDKQIELAHAIQQLQFVEGLDMSSEAGLLNLCKKFSFDEAEFIQKLNSETYRKLALQEFAEVSGMGISGYPAVVLNRGDAYIALSRGYISATALESNLQSGLEYKN